MDEAVKFVEKDHRYVIYGNRVADTSVTSIVSSVMPPFDGVAIIR